MNNEQIWHEYRLKLLRFIRHHIHHPEDAEDILQNVLIKSLQKLDQLQSEENLQAWLIQIARNAIADHYRNKPKGDDTYIIESLAFPEPNIFQELANCLEPLINSLPDKYAKALTYCDLNGSKQADFAEQNQISHSAAKSQVQRGRALLAQKFQACCEFELNQHQKLTDFRPKTSACEEC